MNLLESLKYTFLIQKVLRLSLLTVRNNCEVALRPWSLTLSGLILGSTIFGTVRQVSYHWVETMNREQLKRNPVDQNVFSSIIAMAPIVVGVASVMGVWLTSFFTVSMEFEFYQALAAFDVKLARFIDLQRVYKTVQKRSRVAVGIILFGFVIQYSPVMLIIFKDPHNRPFNFDLENGYEKSDLGLDYQSAGYQGPRSQVPGYQAPSSKDEGHSRLDPKSFFLQNQGRRLEGFPDPRDFLGNPQQLPPQIELPPGFGQPPSIEKFASLPPWKVAQLFMRSQGSPPKPQDATLKPEKTASGLQGSSPRVKNPSKTRKGTQKPHKSSQKNFKTPSQKHQKSPETHQDSPKKGHNSPQNSSGLSQDDQSFRDLNSTDYRDLIQLMEQRTPKQFDFLRGMLAMAMSAFIVYFTTVRYFFTVGSVTWRIDALCDAIQKRRVLDYQHYVKLIGLRKDLLKVRSSDLQHSHHSNR